MSATEMITETTDRIYDEVAHQLTNTVDANSLLVRKIEEVITQQPPPTAREQDSEVAPATLSCAVRNEAERLSSTNEKLEFILENLERCFGALKAY